MISFDEVKATRKELETEYQERHDEQRKLRDFWQGKWWEQDSNNDTISSIFKDLRRNNSDAIPDVKLVHNLLQQVCVKFQTFLSPLPMIKVYVDPPGTQTRKAQANLKERFLYGQWSAGNMAQIMVNVGWYLPLMGDCFLGAFPNLERKEITPILRSPENAYPIISFDGKLQSVIFANKVKESVIKREYPNYTLRADRNIGAKVRRATGMTSNPEIEVLEFSDGNEYVKWADGEKISGVEHNFGFNLFDQLKFISVPDEVWGHGAVEQAVGQIHMGNALYSLMFQSVLDNVFPTLVLIDPSKAPEEIERGPGSVLPINAGGQAAYLTAPTGTLMAHEQFLQQNEQNIKQATSMPDVSFGSTQGMGSIITGKAINELQGAGTGSVVEMVQGVGIGTGLVKWNEKAIFMAQKMFADDDILLFGAEVGSVAELSPKKFAIKLKGKQLVGSPRNEVTFSPYMSMHEKIVMGLQMAGAGLVSKEWQRNQVGIPDSAAMDEEIISEALQDAVVGALVMSIQQEPTPEAAAGVEAQAFDYLNGVKPGPHPLTQTPAMAPQPQRGIPLKPYDQPIPNASPEMPIGMPPEQAQGQAQPQSNVIVLQDAVAMFQNLTDITGRIFLVGEIVDEGETDMVEVAITDNADRQPIMEQLPQLQGKIQIHVVEGTPAEKNQEVTPGVEAGQPTEVPPEMGDIFA